MSRQFVQGRYEVLRLLGEGGMGKVYLARELEGGAQVVVKVMKERLATEARFRQSFIRETRMLAGFRHPHAVAYYDACVDDPRQLCLVMEYVKGVTLRSLIERQGPMEPPRAGRLLGQLCSVLQAAHEGGILHRDLTADNLMIVHALDLYGCPLVTPSVAPNDPWHEFTAFEACLRLATARRR